jgi:hypothetical protein
MKLRIVGFILLISIFFHTEILYASDSKYPQDSDERRRTGFGSIIEKNEETGAVTVLGKDMNLFKKDKEEAQAVTSNKKETKELYDYFWQASVDSVRSMPIVASDSSGGIISTDWHEDDDAKDMRYRFNISIKRTGVTVNAFKQLYRGNTWRNTKEGIGVLAGGMTDKISARARELQAKDKNKI